ncbi:MAG: hypothetical protein Q8M03_07630 [Legionella sp.]|nr:hypothetical protein [Legionella sp.]
MSKEDLKKDAIKSSKVMLAEIPFNNLYSYADNLFETKDLLIGDELIAAEVQFLKTTPLKDLVFEDLVGPFFTMRNKITQNSIKVSNRGSSKGELRGQVLRNHLTEELKKDPNQITFDVIENAIKSLDYSDMVAMLRGGYCGIGAEDTFGVAMSGRHFQLFSNLLFLIVKNKVKIGLISSNLEPQIIRNDKSIREEIYKGIDVERLYDLTEQYSDYGALVEHINEIVPMNDEVDGIKKEQYRNAIVGDIQELDARDQVLKAKLALKRKHFAILEEQYIKHANIEERLAEFTQKNTDEKNAGMDNIRSWYEAESNKLFAFQNPDLDKASKQSFLRRHAVSIVFDAIGVVALVSIGLILTGVLAPLGITLATGTATIFAIVGAVVASVIAIASAITIAVSEKKLANYEQEIQGAEAKQKSLAVDREIKEEELVEECQLKLSDFEKDLGRPLEEASRNYLDVERTDEEVIAWVKENFPVDVIAENEGDEEIVEDSDVDSDLADEDLSIINPQEMDLALEKGQSLVSEGLAIKIKSLPAPLVPSAPVGNEGKHFEPVSSSDSIQEEVSEEGLKK